MARTARSQGTPRTLAVPSDPTDACGRPAPATAAAASPEVDWLSPEQLSAWLSVVTMMMRLPPAVDAELQRDAGMSMPEYQTLAMLSERPTGTMRMSELAEKTVTSLSRLSHMVTRMEHRELVRRQVDCDDGRFTNAILTDEGRSALERAAPYHVATVRRLVIDNLSATELGALAAGADRIVALIASSTPGRGTTERAPNTAATRES